MRTHCTPMNDTNMSQNESNDWGEEFDISLYYIQILKFRLIGGMRRNYLFSMLEKNLTIELSISTSC